MSCPCSSPTNTALKLTKPFITEPANEVSTQFHSFLREKLSRDITKKVYPYDLGFRCILVVHPQLSVSTRPSSCQANTLVIGKIVLKHQQTLAETSANIDIGSFLYYQSVDADLTGVTMTL